MVRPHGATRTALFQLRLPLPAALETAGAVTGKMLPHSFAAGSGFDCLEELTAYPITGQLLDTFTDLGVPGMDNELSANDGIFFDENLAGLQSVIDELVIALR
ncbi:MAG: hypothetical protein ACYDAR_17770 [Thermomicrobiales bacterium]